ncbi:hypothetical protein [Janthinobacterium fluminis]|uniref:Type 4a pilus biogenesis protein PilO n=1 Tax=Janthinobacterium fluminis TaxID=2987524 RepID=A0ABT5K0Z1_9BURK|nr:hypothetical protein [Janthinobacterium fluminis]MDC8758643.1 hypothetical protein [Janthinobacterium fluminis]
MAAIKTAAAMPAARAAGKLGPRLAWEARRLWRRSGWAGAAGAAGLALAALALQQTPQLEARQRALGAQLAAAGKAAAAPAPLAGAAGAAGGVAAFYAFLPAHDAIPEQLKELVGVAQKNGVTLAKAEYKAQSEQDAGFLRYQITLPVKAEYAGVQSFIVGALQTLPTLTLESVLFKREQIEAGEVEARIQFVLLVKQPEPRR